MRRRERGSAIVLAMLVSVILTLLGISFLLMSETESRIAENEKLAAQALYAADAATRVVKHWFDRPGVPGPIPFPDIADVRRDLRVIDEDGAGPIAPHTAASGEAYKDSVDLDADGADDLFDRPYRGSVQDALLGTADGPDMRIEDATFLNELSDDLFADYPAGAAGLRARVARIDVYGPPTIETDGGWARFGIGTVRVLVRIVDDGNIVAEREVAAVLNEVPYRGSYGPLHSCGGLSYQTGGVELPLHWGPVTAVGTVVVSSDLGDYPQGPPRSTSGFPQRDPLWGPIFNAPLSAYTGLLPPGTDLGDPWFRLLTAESIGGLPAGGQPEPSSWLEWDGTGAPPGAPDPDPFVDHSNLAQGQYIECPEYDYDTWRMIATSGGADVRYFAWDRDDLFREDGRGPSRSFRDITDTAEGLFFFDTRDGLPPAADGSNLTPAIALTGGTWSFRGMLYLNAAGFQTDGVSGVTSDLVAPGEPFEDLDQDGRFDAGDESWIDLAYPNTLAGSFAAGGPVGRQEASTEVILDSVSVSGILYTNGTFEATGTGRYYGTVVARGGVVQTTGASGVPEIYWDASIAAEWPGPGVRLPRVVLTSWTTDP
jgi:hypothetical protein